MQERSEASNRMVRSRQIGVIKSTTLQCLARYGPERPRYRIQIAGFATDHHRAYSFHWLPVTSRMHDATIRCTASLILATLPGWNTNAFSFLVPHFSMRFWSNLQIFFFEYSNIHLLRFISVSYTYNREKKQSNIY